MESSRPAIRRFTMLPGVCSLRVRLSLLNLQHEFRLTRGKCRSRTLRCRASPPPRHPRLSLHSLLPHVLLVRSRRLAHRTPLLRARRPPIPSHWKLACREQVLPPLHIITRQEAQPYNPECLDYVVRPARIPNLTVVELLRLVAAECGEGRS